MSRVRTPPQSIDIAAAVNDREVLANCLQRSPDIARDRADLRIYEGFASAAKAYNRALDEAKAAYVVLVHQDVYLPADFLARLQKAVDELTASDPSWGVAGVIGLTEAGEVAGETWSSGLRQTVGRKVAEPTRIVTLDELLLVVRRASGLKFDEGMPGFHLYAADLVQTARSKGLASYVLDLPVVHHSRPVVCLDAGYRRAYRYMQAKWRHSLPLPNLVCPVERSMLRLLILDGRLRWRNRGRRNRQPATGDPVEIARRLGME
ncbi:MAG: glycosyltransferase [Phenylobacterium sp.]